MLLSNRTMEVVGSSRLPSSLPQFFFPSPSSPRFSCLFLLSFSFEGFPWPRPSACGPPITLASDLRRGAGGVTVGLRGTEVGGRWPQSRRRALHVLVPLGRVHLRRPRNDRRLRGHLAAAASRLTLRGGREGMLRGWRRSDSQWDWSAGGRGDAYRAALRPWRLHHCCRFWVIISALEKIIRHIKRFPSQRPFKAAPTLFAPTAFAASSLPPVPGPRHK